MRRRVHQRIHSLTLQPTRRADAGASPVARYAIASGNTMRRRGGLTLVELIVVIVIVMLIMSIGIGVFIRMRRGAEEMRLQEQVYLTVRTARNNAVQNAGAFIFLKHDSTATPTGDGRNAGVDPRIASMQVFSWERVGAWACDGEPGTDLLNGYNGLDGSLHHADFVPGLYGNALALNACPETIFPSPTDPRSRLDGRGRMPPGNGQRYSYAEIPANTDLDPDLGLRIELYAYIDKRPLQSDAWLINRPESYYVTVNSNGVLEGGTPDLALVSDFRIQPGRWYKIAFQFDRSAYELQVEDMIVARYEINDPSNAGWGAPPANDVPSAGGLGPLSDCASGSPLYLGNANGGMTGMIDAVTIYRLTAGDRLSARKLAGGFSVDPPDTRIVCFLPDGRLDPGVHATPVCLWFTSRKKEYPVLIDASGESLIVDPVAPGMAAFDMDPTASGGLRQ